MSRPIVVTVCMDGSSESWEPQLLPQPWHSPADGGAVRSIKFGSGRLSFYQLIGTQQERFRDRQAECLCGFEVDDQLEFGWLLDRKFAWACAFEDPIGQRTAALFSSLLGP